MNSGTGQERKNRHRGIQPLFRSLGNLHKKLDKPPGTPVYTGSSEPGKTSYTLSRFQKAGLTIEKSERPEEFLEGLKLTEPLWIDVSALHEVPEITLLCDHFGIHPLLQEDIVSVGQLPKFENFADYAYIGLKMPFFIHDDPRQVEFEHVSMVLTGRQLITFQEFSLDIFSKVRNRLLQSHGKERLIEPAHVLALLIDSMVDQYYRIIEAYNGNLNKLEDELLGDPGKQFVERVLGTKKQISLMTRYAQPLREALRQLIVERPSVIPESNQPYLRDVFDHLSDILDILHAMQDILMDYINLYNSILSNRLSEVMKTLTIISTVFIPLTFLAGLYGMNFHHMPELSWKYGYPAVIALMLLVVSGMVLFIRKRKWM